MEAKRVDAELVIDGSGDHIKNASLVYENQNITYFGEVEHAPTVKDTEQVPIIMPGMWDCHVHLTGKKNFSESLFTNPHILSARVTWDLKQMYRAGFTSIREMAGIGIYLNKAIMEGSIIGPRIYSAGSILTMTGGHGDRGAAIEVPIDLTLTHLGSEMVDGPVGCQVGVRKMLRKGAEVIKIATSGGGMSITDPTHSQFSIEEIRAIVEEAARAEMYVAAHAHGKDGIRNAINVGVRTIEHGSHLDEDLCDLMIEKDVILIPTTSIPREVPKMLDQLPSHTQEKAEKMIKRWLEAVQLAIKKGVKIAMGTDFILSGSRPVLQYGTNATELQYYVEYGMSPMEAIVTATGNGPLTVGKRAEKTGILKKGNQADFIVLEKNPLDEISVLADRRNILKVVKKGKVY